jgi:CAAX prenyl protease-like protein
MTSAQPSMTGPAAPPAPLERRIFIHHILPFAAWLVLLEVLPATAWGYALRSAAGLALLLWCRPWRYYPRSDPRLLPLALVTGVLVFAIWVLPELPLWQNWPGFDTVYRTWGIFPPWETFPPTGASPYDPAVAGWSLAVVRLLGSGLIIAPIEEFFWRGFLYRWVISRNFLQVDLGRYQAGAFWIVVLLFGLEHDRWLVGMVAGAAYGGLVLKTRDLGTAVIAHMVTNLLLGIYVLASGNFGFW